jgi:hypothetical protein
LGPHHQGREHRLQDRGVIGISEPVGLADKDLLQAQELLKILNQTFAEHLPSSGTTGCNYPLKLKISSWQVIVKW